ncbi:uncharacterized protein LOC124371281 [Homalodisca vitripennis]|uniref:uncharacterized protein LOC124371281 n=1 Tax=Homalodisca vitripennis TaxID=197043 RepID=UPI001EECE2F0|nr:uncharacterized protein LOC124371281 [Homalodisca vitripennis]
MKPVQNILLATAMPDKNNDVENDKYVEKSRSGQPRKEKLRGKSDINKNTKYRKKVERIPKQKNQTQNKKLERSKANTDVGDIESEIDTENEEGFRDDIQGRVQVSLGSVDANNV